MATTIRHSLITKTGECAMQRKDKAVEYLKEMIFNDEIPDWIIDGALECLIRPSNSYQRNVLANKFFNQLEAYLESI